MERVTRCVRFSLHFIAGTVGGAFCLAAGAPLLGIPAGIIGLVLLVIGQRQRPRFLGESYFTHIGFISIVLTLYVAAALFFQAAFSS